MFLPYWYTNTTVLDALQCAVKGSGVLSLYFVQLANAAIHRSADMCHKRHHTGTELQVMSLKLEIRHQKSEIRMMVILL